MATRYNQATSECHIKRDSPMTKLLEGDQCVWCGHEFEWPLPGRRNKIEAKLDEYNHIMELIRTIIPVLVLGLQIIIIIKLSR